jgi:4-oxalocrotonate tautomerase
MPTLSVHLRTVSGLFSEDRKQDLMDKLTDLLAEAEGGGDPEFRNSVWIQIEEVAPQHRLSAPPSCD